MLQQLTTLDDLSWDDNGSWKIVDPLLILDQVVHNLEQVTTLAGLDNSDSSKRDIFSRSAEMFRSLRPGLETKLGPDSLSNISISRNPNEIADTFAIEFFDDWLVDFLSPQAIKPC